MNKRATKPTKVVLLPADPNWRLEDVPRELREIGEALSVVKSRGRSQVFGARLLDIASDVDAFIVVLTARMAAEK